MEYKDIISRAEIRLRILLNDNKIAGHDIEHMLSVSKHAEEALKLENIPQYTKLQVQLAALLHDADDKKIFGESKNFNNARKILFDVISLSDSWEFYKYEYNRIPESVIIVQEYRATYIKFIIDMINLVSCSNNGDKDPPISWMAIPRDCDRLEAIGEIGVQRCLEVTKHFKSPFHTSETPRVYTENELWNAATNQKFIDYSLGKRSIRMIDHYYDKLLHIGKSKHLKSQNKYILDEANKRNKFMIDYVLNYWIL